MRSEPWLKRSEPGSKRSEPWSKRSEPVSKRSEPGLKRSELWSKRSETGSKRSQPWLEIWTRIKEIWTRMFRTVFYLSLCHTSPLSASGTPALTRPASCLGRGCPTFHTRSTSPQLSNSVSVQSLDTPPDPESRGSSVSDSSSFLIYFYIYI